jgi:hypothetical protein
MGNVDQSEGFDQAISRQLLQMKVRREGFVIAIGPWNEFGR